MSVLSYNEILPKKIIEINDEPFEVVSAHVFRKQQRKPVNQTKLRSLISGRVVEQTFHQNESAEEADVEKQTIQYLYENKGEYWFCEEGNPKNRFSLSADVIGAPGRFLKANTSVEAILYNEKVIGVRLPIKVELLVKEAPPSVKGNTVQGGTKQVTLESGAQLNVPMFINEGDVLRINTETGDYVERVSKA